MRHISQLAMENFKPARITRQSAEPVSKAFAQFVRANHLSTGLILKKVSDAWDEASGAARWTVNRYYRDGVFTVTLSSSMLRTQLVLQVDEIAEKMNKILSEDEIVAMCGFETRIKQIKLR